MENNSIPSMFAPKCNKHRDVPCNRICSAILNIRVWRPKQSLSCGFSKRDTFPGMLTWPKALSSPGALTPPAPNARSSQFILLSSWRRSSVTMWKATLPSLHAVWCFSTCTYFNNTLTSWIKCQAVNLIKWESSDFHSNPLGAISRCYQFPS